MVLCVAGIPTYAQFTTPCYNTTTNTWGPCVLVEGSMLSGSSSSQAEFVKLVKSEFVPAGNVNVDGISGSFFSKGCTKVIPGEQGTSGPSPAMESITCGLGGVGEMDFEIALRTALRPPVVIDIEMHGFSSSPAVVGKNVAYTALCRCTDSGSGVTTSLPVSSTGPVTLSSPEDAEVPILFEDVACSKDGPGDCDDDDTYHVRVAVDVVNTTSSADIADFLIKGFTYTYDRLDVSD